MSLMLFYMADSFHSARTPKLRLAHLKRPAPSLGKLGVTLHLNPRPVSASSRLLHWLPLSVRRFASLRFRPKNMSQHIFQFESELQNSSQEAAPSSPSLSPTVSEKLERYGSSALSGVEHLTLIVGKEDLALPGPSLRFSQGHCPVLLFSNCFNSSHAARQRR